MTVAVNHVLALAAVVAAVDRLHLVLWAVSIAGRFATINFFKTGKLARLLSAHLN